MQTENVGTFSLDENVWQGISLSDSAVRQITKLMQQDPQVKGLQLGVKQFRLRRLCLCAGSDPRTR